MISVCIATYNGEKYIREQLDSILCQLGKQDEIIISDDYSTDNTLSEIKKISDKRIKIFINTKTKGYTRNFENALEKSSGDIIFLSDQDDVWHIKKVEKTLEELKKCDFVISDAEVVDNNLKLLNKSYFKLRGAKKGLLSNIIKCRYLGACYAFKRNVLNKSLPFPLDQKKVPHDYWLALIGESFFNLKLLNEPLIKYRRHNLNASTGGEKSNNSFIQKLDIRVYIIKHIIMVAFK